MSFRAAGEESQAPYNEHATPKATGPVLTGMDRFLLRFAPVGMTGGGPFGIANGLVEAT